MKLVLSQIAALAPDLRDAIEGLVIQIAQAYHVSHTEDDRVMRTLVSVYHTTTQSHTTSGTFEAVNFNADDDLRSIATIDVPSGVHDTTTRPDRVVVPGNPGGPMRWCRVRARVTFAANATGDRGLRIKLDDTVVRRPIQMRATTASSDARVTAVASFPASPGQAIHVEAFQDSGGALTLGSTSRLDANECEVEFI